LLFASLVMGVCTNICQNVTVHTHCQGTLHCGKGVPGDLDFFILSYLYLPAYCNSLSRGFDPTLAHAPNTTCVEQPASVLSIHGLWPNYYGGFPFCCNQTRSPLDIAHIMRPLLVNLTQSWSDPAVNDTQALVCGLLNHEWMKHGTCLLPLDPSVFFYSVLNLNLRLAKFLAGVNKYAGSSVLSRVLAKSFSKDVQLVCDHTLNPPSHLLEVRLCFDKNRFGLPEKQIDCPPLVASGQSGLCPNNVTLI